MIDVTPVEVRKKKEDFRRVLRGYDPADVDVFLEVVADRMEALVRENAGYSEQVRRIEAQMVEYKERERALTEALVSAQAMREEVKRQATKDAELLRREAEADATRIRASALQACEREEEGLRRIRARRAQLVQSYRAFLEREIAELAVLSETLDLAAAAPPGAGPARTEAADEVGQDRTRAPAGDGPVDVTAEGGGKPVAASSSTEERPAPGSGSEDYSEGLDWLSSLLKEET